MSDDPMEDRTPTEVHPLLGLLLVLAEIAARVQGEQHPPDTEDRAGEQDAA